MARSKGQEQTILSMLIHAHALSESDQDAGRTRDKWTGLLGKLPTFAASQVLILCTMQQTWQGPSPCWLLDGWHFGWLLGFLWGLRFDGKERRRALPAWPRRPCLPLLVCSPPPPNPLSTALPASCPLLSAPRHCAGKQMAWLSYPSVLRVFFTHVQFGRKDHRHTEVRDKTPHTAVRVCHGWVMGPWGYDRGGDVWMGVLIGAGSTSWYFEVHGQEPRDRILSASRSAGHNSWPRRQWLLPTRGNAGQPEYPWVPGSSYPVPCDVAAIGLSRVLPSLGKLRELLGSTHFDA